ncbi:MAG: AAA family ATPase [Azonexus sp.]
MDTETHINSNSPAMLRVVGKAGDGTKTPPHMFRSGALLKLKSPSWLVEGHIERDTLGVAYGQPSAGKSFFALDLALSVAAGRPFNGMSVKQGAAFYIAGEGFGGLARRVHAWAKHHDFKLEHLPFFVSTRAANFTGAPSAEPRAIRDEIEEWSTAMGVPVSLIIVDTMARNFRGDENSATEVGGFVAQLDAHLRNHFGATVVLIHHCGKSEERGARGSSALRGAVDFEIEMSRNEESGIVKVAFSKMKESDLPMPWAFTLEHVEQVDEDGKDASSAVLVPAEYIVPPSVEVKGLGTNQLTALAVLKEMHEKIVREFELRGTPDLPVRIEIATWKKEVTNRGIGRERLSEIVSALEVRRLIRQDYPHVHLMTT